MMRLLGLALLLATSLPAQAQFRALTANPTVWVSGSVGVYSWTEEAAALTDDNVVGNISLSMASPRWMLQSGFQIVRPFELIGPINPFPVLSSGLGESGSSYHTVYAISGPWTTSEWFMAGVAVGPALTWGTQVKSVVGDCYDNFCPLFGQYESERYISPGLAGSVQGFVRLDGRVWLGGETMLVASTSGTHLAPRLAVRVDLLRPD